MTLAHCYNTCEGFTTSIQDQLGFVIFEIGSVINPTSINLLIAAKLGLKSKRLGLSQQKTRFYYLF